MADGTTSGRGRLLGYALSETWRATAFRLHGSILYRARYAGPAPERLLIAPTDLRTTDPTIAHDIYSGRFIFGGEVVDADGVSVFQVPPPSEEWARRLHGFGWLRHLRASEMVVSRSNGRSLVGEWIDYAARHHPIADDPEVVARRILSWLSQSPLILEGCDHLFYRRFMRALTKQIRWLRRVAPNGPPGMPRLRIMVALAAASVAVADQDRFIRQAVKWLDAEIERQILPDGGHVSRNPGAVLDLLADLLPLRQAFAARGIQPSQALIAAVDRMMPMVRFFRHGDGAFGRFNGVGETPADLVATVLAYDDARGTPLQGAPHSGYQRVAGGATVVLVDSGGPPPIPVSGLAHAGCLSFELSTGRQPIIVNCGSPGPGSTKLRRLARTTAAHSTATINDTSSCRFLSRPGLSRRFGEVIVAGPRQVPVNRATEDDGIAVAASHDGYADRFGIVHERWLKLSGTGHRLEGVDSFLTPGGAALPPGGSNTVDIRFHLHPGIRATPADDGLTVRLVLPDGETWEFASETLPAALEESIYFSEIRGNRRTQQIVLSGLPSVAAVVGWSLQRVGLGNAARRPA